MNSWQVSQLKFAFGIGGFMSFYGIVGLIVYMLPASTASVNQKIVIVGLILLTMPFTLLIGYLVTRRSKRKEENAAAANASASGQPAPGGSAAVAQAAPGAKLAAPAGTYNDHSTGAEEVVQFLKTSNLGEGSKEAVYSLPWYIVAGDAKA